MGVMVIHMTATIEFAGYVILSSAKRQRKSSPNLTLAWHDEFIKIILLEIELSS